MRIVKAPDVRRAEIMAVANKLFQMKGYTKTSVDEIVREAQIAKGTFYYYFKSKEEILDALTEQLVIDMAEGSEQIVHNEHLNAIDKICAILSQQKSLTTEKQSVVDGMHLPENKALHERINIETVRVFGPILAKVVEQGNQEGVFQVEDPLSTVQFILAGSQFLLGQGIFNWSIQEEQARTQAMFTLIERAFAAKPGSILTALSAGLASGQ
ncbi:TetR/AcrR family transcriptional regulator [Neisseria sp. Ec49-e6-T10]|uniref:TetR/AcrR family transcriptional regulator n=1 Tax=Neisseria sp. Ec49-e6-T10 TaxID=3140744 RepID=UPI003EBACD5F